MPDARRAEHWDAAYRSSGPSGVSWFQPTASTSVELIEHLDIPTGAAVIDIGGGASVLADALLDRGFSDVSVLDVSKTALETVRQRRGTDSRLSLIDGDLRAWKPERHFDLWHDRAVFHFLVDSSDRKQYIHALRSTLRPGGTVIMATFAVDGPEHCSGLPVARYSAADLAEILGPEFEVIEQSREEHVTPGGVTQPFTWLVARRAVGTDAV
jgi:2-polyprenyl-3-methyl-5-hydroxy-6-metoxy-1,4-benzoquinol methylase